MILAPVLAVLLAAAPAPGRAAPQRAAPAECGPPVRAPGPLHWRTGESFTFDLDLLGLVKAGTLEVSVERPMSGGAVIPLRARAKTDASVGNVRKIAGVGLSWIEAKSLLPERYREESEENGVHRMTDAKLLPRKPEIVIDQKLRTRDARLVVRREGEVLDPLSTLFLLRSAPLAAGDRFCFDLVGNGRFWRVEATVAPERDRVETGAGAFDTIRIDAVATRKDRRGPSRPLHLWLSADARRIPVAAVTEVEVGPVRATLARMRGTASARR
ncbi:MAG TPA: DUF3108 domain-containing protein [Anaeromyxobacteraceae bacterium]|nr:DUF3108 domain-containing protein [Anaeromyxobacteraceae bacterium]